MKKGCKGGEVESYSNGLGKKGKWNVGRSRFQKGEEKKEYGML